MSVHAGGRGPGHIARKQLLATAFSPASLFAASEVGAWYDPSDLATVWQDNTRTTPGAVGSAVGCIDDKSGNGFNATQATAGNRPILRESGGLYYLEFDGSDDWLQTAAIDFTGTDEMSVFAGVNSTADNRMIAELSASAETNGAWFMLSASGVGGTRFRSAGTTFTDILSADVPEPSLPWVYTGLGDISAPSAKIRRNASEYTSTDTQGTGNYGNHALYIGRRGGSSLPFSGNLYGLIVRGALTSGDTLTNTETWLNSKTGAY
jgi:hypothetical protein